MDSTMQHDTSGLVGLAKIRYVIICLSGSTREIVVLERKW